MAADDPRTNEPTPAELRPARQRFIGSFTRRCDELTQLARNAPGDGPNDELGSALHRLATSARLAGFREVSQLALSLEGAARAEHATMDDLVARLTPLREAYAHDQASPPAWAIDEQLQSHPEHLSLVLAEDDEMQRLAMTRVLEGAGHSVTGVARGDEVLAVVKRQKPAILILDIELPGLDGHAICRLVKADPDLTEIGVVFVTAAVSNDSRLAGLLLGADDYIEKPVRQTELVARLAAVAARRARQEPARLATGELSYAAFVGRVTELLQRSGGALVLLRMPADMGLPVASWLVRELRRDDLLGRYRDDLRILFLPGLRTRTAARHIADIVRRLASAGLPVSSGCAVSEGPAERTLAGLLQDADARLTLPPAPGADAVLERRPSVLIADDDEMTRRLAELPLQRARFPCRTAVDGQDALDQMNAEMPDVLILDLSMPRLDGLQVLEALAARGGPRPLTIVISANRREDDVRRALSMGAQDYVVKPFNPLTLLARVRRLLA